MDRNYQRQSGPGIGSLILNLLTLGVLLMTLCAGGAMTVVFINPATIERISPLLPIKLVVPPGNPVAAENSVNELACDYLGIGGQVFDLTGSPVFNLDLHVTGNLDGQAIDLHSLTGTSGVPSIGPGAYLINLADHPIASTGSMQIVLSDTSGTPLSAAIGFDTSGECEFNFVLFNWRQEY